MALWPIFKVYAKETGYNRGERFCEQWWRQTAAERQLKTTLKNILAEVWERQGQESDRRGEEEGGEEESGYGDDG